MKHYEAKRWAEAARGFDEAIQEFPTNAVPTYNRACVAALQGDAAKAAAQLRAYAPLNPEWRDKVAADHDFDGVRASPALRALDDQD